MGRREELAKKAIAHTEEMAKKYADEIKGCCNRTITYEGDTFNLIVGREVKKRKITVEPIDTVSAIHRYYLSSSRLGVLNFASYKNPGGRFLDGSMAQEECLCHDSYLYNVLSKFDDSYYKWNREHKNKALYLNRGLFTPNVRFESNGVTSFAGVITVAAPNYGAAKRYGQISFEENLDALVSRITFVLYIAESQHIDTLILGAFGCGVFRQNPIDVATIFKLRLENMENGPKRVVFAVPTTPYRNYEVFKDTFKGAD